MDYEGVYYVEFTNGEIKEIDILTTVMHSMGWPIVVIGADGKSYNWMTIISLWKKV